MKKGSSSSTGKLNHPPKVKVKNKINTHSRMRRAQSYDSNPTIHILARGFWGSDYYTDCRNANSTSGSSEAEISRARTHTGAHTGTHTGAHTSNMPALVPVLDKVKETVNKPDIDHTTEKEEAKVSTSTLVSASALPSALPSELASPYELDQHSVVTATWEESSQLPASPYRSSSPTSPNNPKPSSPIDRNSRRSSATLTQQTQTTATATKTLPALEGRIINIMIKRGQAGTKQSLTSDSSIISAMAIPSGSVSDSLNGCSHHHQQQQHYQFQHQHQQQHYKQDYDENSISTLGSIITNRTSNTYGLPSPCKKKTLLSTSLLGGCWDGDEGIFVEKEDDDDDENDDGDGDDKEDKGTGGIANEGIVKSVSVNVNRIQGAIEYLNKGGDGSSGEIPIQRGVSAESG